jgi:hypothetical protein
MALTSRRFLDELISRQHSWAAIPSGQPRISEPDLRLTDFNFSTGTNKDGQGAQRAVL